MPANKPRKQPDKQTFSQFVRALRHIAESRETPKASDIQALSMPTTADIAEFRKEWTRVSPERRRAIVTAMNEAAEQSVQSDFTDLFIVLLDDEDEIVRAGAITGLWENEMTSVGKRLLKLVMEDSSALVRAAAAEGLGHFLLVAEEGRRTNPSSAAITEALLTRFHDPAEDDTVRRHSLESMAYSSDERTHNAIAEAYGESDQDMRISAVFAMGRSADTSWAKTILRELKNDDPAMRYEAAYAAGELMIVDALPHLVALVNDLDGQVRESAVWALGQIGGREARRALESILEGDDDTLHEAAEDALAELEFAEGVTPFSMFDFEVVNPAGGNGHAGDDEAAADEETDDEEKKQ